MVIIRLQGHSRTSKGNGVLTVEGTWDMKSPEAERLLLDVRVLFVGAVLFTISYSDCNLQLISARCRGEGVCEADKPPIYSILFLSIRPQQ